MDLQCLGLINHDESDLCKNHIGVAFVAELKDNDVTDTPGILQWVAVDEIAKMLVKDRYEPWAELAWQLFQQRHHEIIPPLSFDIDGNTMQLHLEEGDYAGIYHAKATVCPDPLCECWELTVYFPENDFAFDVNTGDGTLDISDCDEPCPFLDQLQTELSRIHTNQLVNLFWDLKEKTITPRKRWGAMNPAPAAAARNTRNAAQGNPVELRQEH